MQSICYNEGHVPTLKVGSTLGIPSPPAVHYRNVVRKLTPRECLNFQGFPKNFNFPHDIPISQKYKQAGNAVTVNLIKKIAIILKKILNK